MRKKASSCLGLLFSLVGLLFPLVGLLFPLVEIIFPEYFCVPKGEEEVKMVRKRKHKVM